jgi:hypothetical protein
MWDYAPDGEVYYEKFLAFARTLLANWRALDVAHSLSVVFFTRMYYYQHEAPPPSMPPSAAAAAAGPSSVRTWARLAFMCQMSVNIAPLVL